MLKEIINILDCADNTNVIVKDNKIYLGKNFGILSQNILESLLKKGLKRISKNENELILSFFDIFAGRDVKEFNEYVESPKVEKELEKKQYNLMDRIKFK